jgi:four helix bundle protein
MFRFEKLEVWQKAVELAGEVYKLTRQFPVDERFGLIAQMRRAAVSVSSNIAEGSGRGSDADFARFMEIAYGSLMELVSQTQIAHLESLIDQSTLKSLDQKSDEVARMLSGLRSKLLQTP